MLASARVSGVDGHRGDYAARGHPPTAGLGGGGEERVLPFQRGKAILCLFTDGLADARGPNGERFGEQRVLGHVVNLRSRPARHILEAVFTDIAAFTGGAPATRPYLVLLKVGDDSAAFSQRSRLQDMPGRPAPEIHHVAEHALLAEPLAVRASRIGRPSVKRHRIALPRWNGSTRSSPPHPGPAVAGGLEPRNRPGVRRHQKRVRLPALA